MIADSTRSLAASASSAPSPGATTRPPILVPVAALLLLTLVNWSLGIDLTVARSVYEGNQAWAGDHLWIVPFLYRYGPWPTIAAAVAAAAVWIGSRFATRLRPYRPLARFMVLVLLLGPGLVINSLFKQFGGRPRPREIAEFGGNQTFLVAGELRPGQAGHSFPSGHASMGFYWLALFAYHWRRNHRLAAAFALLGLAHGTIIGAARVVQGAHWLSDIYWSAFMVYLVAWILHRLLKLDPTAATRFIHESIPPPHDHDGR